MTEDPTVVAATAVLRCYSGVASVRVLTDESEPDFPGPLPLSGVPAVARLSVVDGQARLEFPGTTLPAEVVRCIAEDLDAALARLRAAPDTPPEALLPEPATEHLGPRPVEPAGGVDHSIPELFWAGVAAHPDRVAVLDHGVPLTYGELGARVAALAHLLVDVHSGQRVGLLLDHGAGTIAGILATLTVGGVYVPLDPRYPTPRLAAMSTQAGVSAVLTTAAHRALAEALAPEARVLDVADAPERADRPNRPLPGPDAAAYVLHTSGSTGLPKGVVQRHRNVLHQVRLHRTNFGLTQNDRLSVVSSFGFDMAVTDTFSALLSGACCVPVDVREVGLAGLADALRRDRVSVYHSTPTVFRYLFDGLTEPLPDLRAVLLGGEAVTVADLERCRRHLPAHGVLVNGYGATEISFAAQHPVPVATGDTPTVVPIGRPLHGIRVGLLAEDGTPSALAGEMAVSSEFLAGYWAPAEEAAARFDTDHAGVPRYRTGDLARRRPDGSLEYLGRRDRQVKVRGYRVEPGEVEVALGALPGVARCAVVPDRRGEEQLLRAFVVPDGVDLTQAAVRARLGERLPDHLVPETVETVPDLPLTPTGKVDAAALLAGRPPPAPAAVEVAGGTSVADVVAGVWADVLGRADIGRHDRFFDLGGHSLLVATVHRRLRAALDRDFPLTAIYEHPTVAALAAHLDPVAERVEVDRVTERMARRARRRAIR
ncbi:non-ribosomal peptide synthetase [Actinophytocola gossypii]|uniref:Non-ribosomal peptide synthetase n=1 Tax=Actinophytocola gossypii TaxID=2812003 RepID=A0ABT2J251_9PSEU|nr:non-ribosomal peptide synthetase [Actinophytocola gossypii]MCT2581937.1 non-ribosomal peptide synthetase [Actinophytocola gossypii]